MSRLKSISFPFRIDANLGQLMEEQDHAQHVEQLVKQVLLTNKGERANRSDFGADIRRMVFRENSEVNANLAQVAVLQALERWLSSVIQVSEVKVKPVNERLEISIKYILIVNRQQRYLNLEITP